MRLVILCGNAGDGKTALLQHLARRLGLGDPPSAERIVKGRLEDGLIVRMNLDGSASWRGRSADQLLDDFLAGPRSYSERAFSPGSDGRQGEVLRELVRFDPALDAHPQVDRRLLQPPPIDDDSDLPRYEGLSLAAARRRAWFEWPEDRIERLMCSPPSQTIWFSVLRSPFSVLRSPFSVLRSTDTDTDTDTRFLVRNVANSRQERALIDRIKQMDRFRALYFAEGKSRPSQIALSP